MATIGPNRQKNIVRIATEMDPKDANFQAATQAALKSATSGKQTSAKGGGTSSTASKQKNTPAAKSAGASDSKGTASAGRQTQATPRSMASTEKTRVGGGGVTGGGAVPSLSSGTGITIPQNRLTQLQRIEQDLENDYHFLQGFEQDRTGEKLYEEENWADQTKKVLETVQGWISEMTERTNTERQQGGSGYSAQALEDVTRLGMSMNSASLAAAKKAVSSPDYLKRASDSQQTLLDQAERDVTALQTRIYELEQFGNLTRGGETLTSGSMSAAPTRDDLKLAELQKQLAEASGRVGRYGQTVTNLSARYYSAENQGQLTKLAQDQSLSQSYQKVEELRQDMETIQTLMAETGWLGDHRDQVGDELWASLDDKLAGLSAKYGYTGGKDQQALAGLILKLREQQQPLVAALEQAGYDYNRMSGYEQTLRDAEQYQKDAARTAQFAEEHPVLSSAASILAAPFQGGEYVGKMLGGIGTSDERDLENYVPMNVYDMKFTNFVTGVREEVAGNIEESIDNEMLGKAAVFLYRTGMSIGNSAFQIATLGPAGSWVMGANAASQQARDVILRGGSNRQAFWSGLAAGAAEKIFEKFGIDSLLSERTVTGVKSLLKETAKQAEVEAGEEMLTEISNILADTVIMGKNSELERLVDWYMGEELLTEEEARERAFFDQLTQVGLAGFGGALSGGTMGGVKAGIDYRSAGRRNEQPKQTQGKKKEGEIHLADPEGRGYNNRGVSLLENMGQNGRDEAQTGNTTDVQVSDVDVQDAKVTGSLNADLLEELASSGVKYNQEDVVAIIKTADKRLIWLENGTETAGLNHIISAHAKDFQNMGIAQEQISDYVMNAIQNGKIVGYQGRGTGRPIYEFMYNGKMHRVAITVGSNGFVVGANPG